MSSKQPSTYIQGHSPAILRSHQARTVTNSAAFLLPRLLPHQHLLDIGCGPGTITSGFTTYLTSGSVTGVDLSPSLIEQNTTTFPSSNYPTLSFETGNVLEGLKYEDESFDVIFTNQTVLHLPDPIKAIKEMYRLLRPGGMLAMRESDRIDWYPPLPGLELYITCQQKMMTSTGAPGWYRARELQAWARKAGFERAKMVVGGGASVASSEEERAENAAVHLGRLRGVVGEKFRELGLVGEGELEDMMKDLEQWRDDVDGWSAVWQCEVIARK